MWPAHCVQNTAGAEFHKALKRGGADVVVRKGTQRQVDSYSGFGDATPGHSLEKTTLEAELKARGISTLVIGGASTVLAAWTGARGRQPGLAPDPAPHRAPSPQVSRWTTA